MLAKAKGAFLKKASFPRSECRSQKQELPAVEKEPGKEMTGRTCKGGGDGEGTLSGKRDQPQPEARSCRDLEKGKQPRVEGSKTAQAPLHLGVRRCQSPG